MIRLLGNLFFALTVATAIAYGCLLGANHVYISGDFARMIGSDMNPIWDVYKNEYIRTLPGLNDFGPIFVEQLTAWHALRNAFYIFYWTAIAVLVPLFLAVLALAGILSGIFRARWDDFLAGIVAAIAAPLSIFVIGLDIIATYFLFLFQPSTPAYTAIWLLPGLLGVVGGSTAPVAVIIIIIQGPARLVLMFK